ncbi:MAG: hypothetical protein ACWA42_02275 [Lutibacter sp.]
MSNKKDDSDIKKWAIIATIIIVVLWAITFFIPYDEKSIVGERGTFGDMFGAVNALFSGLAFAGIIITIILQSRELKLQREELADTRKVFEEQSGLMAAQQNDNTFFNLLDNHRKLIESFKEGYGASSYELLEKNNNRWKEVFELYTESYQNKRILNLELYQYVDFNAFIDSYPDMHTFFREVLHIHKFIDTKLSDNKEFYKEALKHSMTNKEHFIFETLYQNFPSERNGVEYNPLFYLRHQYVDFNTCTLPKIKACINGGSFSKKYLFIESDCEISKMELLINHRDEFNQGEVELYEILNIDLSINKQKFDIEKYLNLSKLKIEKFPLKNDFNFREFQFIFKIVLNHNNRTYDFAFDLNFRTRSINLPKEIKRFEIDDLSINEISIDKYESIKNLDVNSPTIPLDIDILLKINPINNEVRWYFKENPDESIVSAENLMDRFNARKIFDKKELKNGIPIINILNDLDKINRLDLIKNVFQDRKAKHTMWYFQRSKS